jgi:hypothetical protein
MREKQNRPTQQTSTTSTGERRRRRNDIVCTFYKQNMTMRKRRKAPSTKR